MRMLCLALFAAAFALPAWGDDDPTYSVTVAIGDV